MPQDDAQAVKWFRRAAEQGDAFGQNNMGWAYTHGRGVPQDYLVPHPAARDPRSHEEVMKQSIVRDDVGTEVGFSMVSFDLVSRAKGVEEIQRLLAVNAEASAGSEGQGIEKGFSMGLRSK